MYVFGSGRRGWRVDEKIGIVLYQCCGNRGNVGCVSVFVVGSGSGGWCYGCVSCESIFSVYMAGTGICILRLVDTCNRCTQCSILLHLMDNCFLPCVCLWQISQIQTCLCVVVGPGHHPLL